MAMSSFSWFLLIAHCLLVARLVTLTVQQQVLSQDPHGIVPVADTPSEEEVVFTCVVEGGRAAWDIGTLQYNQDDLYYADKGVTITNTNLTCSMLSLAREALGKFNRSTALTVQCYVRLPFRAEYGDFAAYIIQYGAPSAPTGLYLSTTSFLHVTWERPPIHKDVPINYTIDIVNIRTGVPLQHTVTSQESVAVTQTPNHTCEPHSITVMAWNDAGESETMTIYGSIPPSLNISVVSQSLSIKEVSLLNDSNVTATVTFMRATKCNPDYHIRNHTISVDQLPGSLTATPTTPNSPLFTAVLTTEQFPGLVANRVYHVRVTVCIDITCRTSDSVELKTLDLHSTTVTYSNTSSQEYLQCVYTDGSTASGCRFSFTVTTSNGSHTQTVSVKRGESSGLCVTANTWSAGVADISVSALDSGGQVVGPAVVPNVIEEEGSLSDCPAALSSESSDDTGKIVAGVLVPLLVVPACITAVIVCIYMIKCWKLEVHVDGWKIKITTEQNQDSSQDSSPTESHDGVIEMKAAGSDGASEDKTPPQRYSMVQFAHIKKTGQREVELHFLYRLAHLPDSEVTTLYVRQSQS